jgi:CIC family chloride channel protein
MALRMMLLLIVLKLFGVTLSYATGNAGGIFGPALVLGSMLGGAVGTVAHHYFPAYTAAPGAYALVGMGALFAGIVRVPMTSVLMIFEMTRDYAVIVPLMIANMTSLFIASIFQKVPIYEALADQDGIHLPSSEDRRALSERTVSSVMNCSPHVLTASISVADALSDMTEGQFRTLPVIDGEALVGLVSKVSLEKAITEDASGTGQGVLRDLTVPNYAFVHADQPLYIALERMSKSRLDMVPVVHRANIHALEGIVTLREVLDSYGVEDVDLLGQHAEL